MRVIIFLKIIFPEIDKEKSCGFFFCLSFYQFVGTYENNRLFDFHRFPVSEIIFWHPDSYQNNYTILKNDQSLRMFTSNH